MAVRLSFSTKCFALGAATAGLAGAALILLVGRRDARRGAELADIIMSAGPGVSPDAVRVLSAKIRRPARPEGVRPAQSYGPTPRPPEHGRRP